MAKNRTPIAKLSRRLGISLGKDKYVQRRPYPPGVHGPKYARRKPRLSSYGEQLLEKQKAKAVYGIMERQFRNYFAKASAKKGNTGETLIQLLELRLDNAVYRLGLAKTRRQARQMVSHRFIMVNGQSVNVPSFSVKTGDIITIKESKQNSALIKEVQEPLAKHETPSWLSMDAKTMTGKVTGLPEGEDLQTVFDPTLIVEFYSR